MRKKISISLITLLFLTGTSLTINGQSPQFATANTLAPPIVPLMFEYEFAPLYFSQWELDDANYSRITAIVTEGEVPVCVIILAEKSSGRHVYYSNSEAKVVALKRLGRTAHKTPIDFRVAKTVGQPSTYGLGFRDVQGRAILWRFIPATRPSERGAGLTPLASVPGLRLDYSELGTTAGAGTAVQIGDRVSEAHAWPEISAPPYFVAFRGSHSEGRHLGSLYLGTERWRVLSAPNVSTVTELREGATWKLREANGRELSLRVTARSADEVTITETDESALGLPTLEMKARLTPQGFAIREIRRTMGKRTMRIAFTPELNLANLATTPAEIAFEIDEGEHRRVTHGSVTSEVQTGAIRLRFAPRAPAWAKSQGLISTIRTEAGGYMLEVTRPEEQSSNQKQ